MQQTEKYKLNLIEPSDPFLPEGLNANTQKIEAAMIAHEAKVDAQTAAQGEAITALVKNVGVHGHNCRLLYGVHVGDGQYGEAHPTVFAADFYPVALFMGYHSRTPVMLVRGIGGVAFDGSGNQVSAIWAEHSVGLYSNYAITQFNSNGSRYPYLLLGYDPEE